MVGVTGTDASPWNPDGEACESLRDHTHNVLLEGPVAVVDAALSVIVGSGEQIVWAGSETLGRFNTSTQTLILRNVESLSEDDQRRLLEWLDATASRARIISTTERPLFARVDAGLFDLALYYRLNVILLRFRPTLATQPRSRELAGAECRQGTSAVAF